MNYKTKKITTMAMMVAISFVMVALIRIPIFPAAPFLTYEPKDVIIAIAGFAFGPVEAIIISVAVSLIELFTISATGLWGCLMNILSTLAFVLPGAILYRKNKTRKMAWIGIGIGVVCMTLTMLLWNYLVTPIYMGYPREAVAAMLLPIFLPFNLIKSVLNAVFTMLLYKPLMRVLRRTNILPERNA
ncbi:MAG: ECF transporter S component [Lachnospiraceae bacterium]|jgi:riboflavin transporter FmnP|nr:ECF transporter S component [Lachnospiraceae bacterium]